MVRKVWRYVHHFDIVSALTEIPHQYCTLHAITCWNDKNCHLTELHYYTDTLNMELLSGI